LSDDLEYTEAVEKAYLALLQSDPDQALEHCQGAARTKPMGLEHLYLLGLISMSLKDIGRGIKFLEEGHRRAPNNKEFAEALAALTARVGNMSDSIYYSKLALVTDSDEKIAKFAPAEFEELERNIQHAGVSTYFVDATIAFHERDYPGCVDLCGKELVVHPDNAECHQLLGRAWTEVHEYDEAVTALRRAAELAPGEEQNFVFLGDALLSSGQLSEANEVYREGIEKCPGSVELRNRLIDASAFGSEEARLSGLEEIAPLSEILVSDSKELPARSLASPAPDNRVIVGFLINETVLAESVGFVESIFRAYDREKMKFVVYQQYSQPYAGTTALRQKVDDWRQTYDIDDQTLDLIIRNDRVRVLVDLCGTRPGHRQPLLSGKPAPVCVNWLGFPFAPVPATADVILVDDNIWDTVAASGTDVDLVSLGAGMVAYGGGSVELETGMDAPPPVELSGHVTFGAYLDPQRLVGSAALWATVLKNAPAARLLLGANGEIYPGTKSFIYQLFSDLGVADRVDIPGSGDGAEGRSGFLAAIDILLEACHVCNPSLMCDALWMGVPVVALDGDRPSARIARSVLLAAGRAAWVAGGADDYRQIAVDLATDTKALKKIRGSMRDDLTTSSLCDERAFANRFKDAIEKLAEAAPAGGQT